MDPKIEKALAEFLAEDIRAKREGITLAKVYETVEKLADNFAAHVDEDRKRFDRVGRRLDRHHGRIWGIEKPGREPMPSMSADDSGSIDVSVLGSKASFRGKHPVRVAIAMIAIALALGAGFFIHVALASSQAEHAPASHP